MEKTSCKRKIDEMLPELMNKLREECARLYSCGALNVEEYEDNYLLPKIILCVALKNQSWQYRPLTQEGKKEAKNLERF
ncbi:MAG: hypothetical protein A4E53_01652 [Pelotomaculum sp. PtaB.Bin104]|jgi:hypothetical protein|nr:MAG: hypothetical protein A4E53_01652 [Pelotomaculum sp. PtaB.Bin104]